MGLKSGRCKVEVLDVVETCEKFPHLIGEFFNLVDFQPVFVEIRVECIGSLEKEDKLLVVSFGDEIPDDSVEVSVRFVFPSAFVRDRFQRLRGCAPELLGSLDEVASFEFEMCLFEELCGDGLVSFGGGQGD